MTNPGSQNLGPQAADTERFAAIPRPLNQQTPPPAGLTPPPAAPTPAAPTPPAAAPTPPPVAPTSSSATTPPPVTTPPATPGSPLLGVSQSAAGKGPDTASGGDGGGPRDPNEPQDEAGDSDPERKGLRGLVGGSVIRKLVTAGVTAVAAILVVASVAFGIGYARANVPQPGSIQANQVATIVMRDGTTPVARIIPPEGNRTILPADQIPQVMKNAIMAIEDREFMTNPGFSLRGFARAVWLRVPGVADDGEEAGGGSTITQQYVKNALVGNDTSLVRKWNELILSTKMSRSWTKDEIMAAYLNTIYFGRGAYGVQAASRAYFNVDARDLRVEQAALLAAVVRAPSMYDPTTNPENAQGRWNQVLDGMVEMQTIDPAQRASLVFPQVTPDAAAAGADPLSAGPNGLIRTQVLAELQAAGIDEATLNTQGLTITTTLDPQAQESAVEAARETLEGEPDNLSTAVVSVDPKTGGVLAYYGGEDGSGYDRVQAALQTGSSFKVFALVAALEQGIPMSTTYSSAPLDTTGVRVTNSEGTSCGTCNLATAMRMSLNTVYYRLMLDLNGGAQAVADAAHQAGVAESFGNIPATLQQPDGGVEGGVVLGQYLSRPLDMASAYATLAAEGIYRPPYLVSRVTAADGRVLLDRQPEQGERRIDEDVANNTTAALTPIAAYSNGNSLAGGRPSAAKTGTAQYQDTGLNKDAWMVGYTPSISTAVWVGDDTGGPITNLWGGDIFGSGLPSQIWKAAMDGALADTDWESFPTPGSIGGVAGIPAEAQATRSTSSGNTPSTGSSGTGEPTTGQTVPGIPGLTLPNFPWDVTTPENPGTGPGATGPGGAPGQTGGPGQGGATDPGTGATTGPEPGGPGGGAAGQPGVPGVTNPAP